jgi:putative heme-binding domain-containing protein
MLWANLAIATLEVPDGFVAEKIYAVPRETQGSWISLAFDDRGRLIAGSDTHGLFRMQPPVPGRSEPPAVSQIFADSGEVHGLCYAFDSLYLMDNGIRGKKARATGLYRLRDRDGDDQFESVEHILAMKGGGGHGLHSIQLSPDGRTLTINGGNASGMPSSFPHSRVPRVWDEDQLLPRMRDSNGHASTLMAPGGWIATVGPDGSDFTLLGAGFRNQFDIAYDGNGELFTFDADMEWDMGTPWYRPTRICHVTSGAEFGWRNGSGKWPAYFADSLPAILDIGPSSPTGVLFGTGARFPTRYQKALFVCDWTYGIIYAIKLEAEGASFRATQTPFVKGVPFPVVDATIGPDGALYAVTGGRQMESDLWRVRYVGDESIAPPRTPKPTPEAQLRRQLEAFHGRPQEGALAAAWPQLNHKDRFLRFAARIAVEHQPVEQWQATALAEPDPTRRLHALIALARHGADELQTPLINALLALPFAEFARDDALAHLRACSLALTRMGRAKPTLQRRLAAYLEPHYPHAEPMVNRELCRTLVYLESPLAVPRTLTLLETVKETGPAVSDAFLKRSHLDHYGASVSSMQANPPRTQQMFYAFTLRTAQAGWTRELRQSYFSWLRDAEGRVGGRSYQGFVQRIRQDALAAMPQAERDALRALTGEVAKSAPRFETPPQPKGPGRVWSIDEIAELTSAPLRKRNFANGEAMYHAVLCARCHRFDGIGGDVGPDLTALVSRFSYRAIAEAVQEPSAYVSAQYAAKTLTLTDGSQLIGRIMEQTDDSYRLSLNPLDDSLTTIAKAKIADIAESPLSMMPGGLFNALNKDELLDLLAYLTSRGNPKDRMFR